MQFEGQPGPGRSIEVSDVRFRSASREQVNTGLLGFVTIILADAIEVGGIALRKTADGQRVLSFPCRTDRRAEPRYVVRPVSDAIRRHIEREVFAALGFGDEVPQ